MGTGFIPSLRNRLLLVVLVSWLIGGTLAYWLGGEWQSALQIGRAHV